MNFQLTPLTIGMRDKVGVPVTSGMVYFYAAGTTTLQTVYANAELTVPLSNPSTLSTSGRVVAFTASRIRIIVNSAAGITLYDIDNLGFGPGDISASDLAAGCVQSIAIADGAIGVTKIPAGVVTATKFRDGSVTNSKLGPIAIQVSLGCGAFSTLGANVLVTNLSATVLTTGKLVAVRLISDGVSGASYVTEFGNSGNNIVLLRDAVAIASHSFAFSATTFASPTTSVVFYDIPAAGSHTYTVQSNLTTSGNINSAKLVAYQIG